MTALLDGLKACVERHDLDEKGAYEAMKELMSGSAPAELIAGFLAALRVKGETVPEITGFARAMREASIRIHPKVKGRLIDTCSTGGAAVKTFNVGTTAAFVAAADGAFVAKHGNRSFNRPSGSADVLEALGADLKVPPAGVERLIETVGLGFLFSPNFHPAMKHAASARKTLGVRTVFNLLGPISNPAGAQGQVLGVYEAKWVEPIAQVLLRLGCEHALVLHSEGSDEPSLTGTTRVAEVKDGSVRLHELRAAQFGLAAAPAATYGPLPPADAATEARRILGGGSGPRADVVRYAAGLALYVAGRSPTIEKGVARAQEVLASKAAATKLDEFVAATRREGVTPA